MTEKSYLSIIGVVSVLIPAVVTALLFIPKPEVSFLGANSFLPALNASINSTVAVLLVLGVVFIRKGKIKHHQTMMVSALVLSALFLVSYVLYHYGAEHVVYNGTGMTRIIYLLILFTHIVLSVAVVPLALISVLRGWKSQVQGEGASENLVKHKKIAKITFPIWLYVAVTGVIVYFMAHVFNPVV